MGHTSSGEWKYRAQTAITYSRALWPQERSAAPDRPPAVQLAKVARMRMRSAVARKLATRHLAPGVEMAWKFHSCAVAVLW
jgi:hypothetical protein